MRAEAAVYKTHFAALLSFKTVSTCVDAVHTSAPEYMALLQEEAGGVVCCRQCRWGFCLFTPEEKLFSVGGGG